MLKNPFPLTEESAFFLLLRYAQCYTFHGKVKAFHEVKP